MSIDVLVVDDEADIRDLVSDILKEESFTTKTAANSMQALKILQEKTPSAIILDIWLQGSELDGLGILEIVKKRYPLMPVIVISGHGNIETAVNAMLTKAVFDDAIISRSNFQKSNLRESSFKKATISHSIFYGTDLRQILANYVNIIGCYCESVDLTGVDFTGAIISNSDFTHAIINQAQLKNIKLTNSLFSFSSFQSTDFANTIIESCNFENANFNNVQLKQV